MDLVLQSLSQQLQLAVAGDNRCRKDVYKRFLEQLRAGEKQSLTCPDFAEHYTSGPQWVNTTEPLSFQTSLRGKIVVLDFWTYCCINCMHILPDLHELEKTYPVSDGVVIIGVHSAKFPNEKDTDNIASAIGRYGIEHAVVNDTKASLWHQLGIQCWPTIVVIGPDGKLLNQFIGEGHKEEMIDFVGSALEVYGDQIKTHPLPISPGETLHCSYPTKVLADDGVLVISDSGLHKVFILSLNNLEVMAVVGSGVKGHKDGSFTECQFISPQGACKVGDAIYVVDCDTHYLRKTETVSTLSGTGVLGNDKVGGKCGAEQVLSSPWDVEKYSSKHSQTSTIQNEDVDMLLIAMAGTHQIWAYFLKDATWWKSESYKAGTCVAIVGSGQEENRNNSYPLKCGLAQPSGLCVDYVSSMCYIADSESSTIRQLNLKTGQVKGMLGGAIDPMDLFAFGDEDGKGRNAKLQHPLGICHIPETSYAVIIDSYNHKVKLMKTSPKPQQVSLTTLTISDVVMNEPGGLSYHPDSHYLYIADTNKHCVRRIAIPHDISESMNLTGAELVPYNKPEDETDSNGPLFKHDSKSVLKSTNGPVTVDNSVTFLTITESLPENSHLTEESDSLFRATFFSAGSLVDTSPVQGNVMEADHDRRTMKIIVPTGNILSNLTKKIDSVSIEVVLYYCSDTDNVCMRKNLLITQPVKTDHSH